MDEASRSRLPAPDPDAAVPYREHVGATRQYMRDIILGVNDGLVSMFLLVAGVVGGGLTTTQVLLTGIAGALAGAISMAAGEYMATKSQDEVFAREMRLEREHLQHHRDYERAELQMMFEDLGLEVDDAARFVEVFDRDDEAMMKVMMALEFGVVESERRNPFTAAIASGALFIAGSTPSVLPFVFVEGPALGLALAAVFSGIGLFAVGAVKTMVTRTNPLSAGLENLAVAMVGAGASFAVGRLFDVVVGG